MCFMKKAASMMPMLQAEPAKVERHQADATLTKNLEKDSEPKGYLQNVKTSPIGLEDSANSEKKTLLGE